MKNGKQGYIILYIVYIKYRVYGLYIIYIIYTIYIRGFFKSEDLYLKIVSLYIIE